MNLTGIAVKTNIRQRLNAGKRFTDAAK